MQPHSPSLLLLVLVLLLTSAASTSAVDDLFTRIIQLEDARSLGDGELAKLLQHRLPEVKYRAALAIGRIGDKRGTEPLLKALEVATTTRQRGIIVFALGEIEDTAAAPALLKVLTAKTEAVEVRARAAEALGKIVSFQPPGQGPGQSGGPANADILGPVMVDQINQALQAQLPVPNITLTPSRKLLALLTITALMRVRAPSSLEPLVQQLKSRDAEVRATAANTFSRQFIPAAEVLFPLLTDTNIDVRANGARALGRTKAASAFEPLNKLLHDPSERVQVSAVRGLAALADRRALPSLLNLGESLRTQYQQAKAKGQARPVQISLLLEIVTALGTFRDQSIVPFLQQLRAVTGVGAYTEIETELLKFGEAAFWEGLEANAPRDWRSTATLAQSLAELKSERAKAMLLTLWQQAEQGKADARALPALLRAMMRSQMDGVQAIARQQLAAKDLALRAAAAAVPQELTDENFAVLSAALEKAKADPQSDARLALVNALGRYKTAQVANVLKTVLADADPRVRRRAADLLRQQGEAVSLPMPALPHDERYYARLRRLQQQPVTVTMHTSKGIIKIAMHSQDAPMTVDNFVELAKKKYFDGILFHRVVPNFVVQGGDPRGDGGGGPGYQIRCEINTRMYQRGTVGMALSGKDTGGSQFFFCHAAQPHLDGGYTVFGQVIAGLAVVDQLTRGDVIERVEVR